MEHRIHHRERVLMALNDKRYDTACSTLATAMEGDDDGDGNDEFTDRRSACGWAAVLAGTPDYGQNDTETDCVDALTNVLHYTSMSGCDVERVLRLAQSHFRSTSLPSARSNEPGSERVPMPMQRAEFGWTPSIGRMRAFLIAAAKRAAREGRIADNIAILQEMRED